MNTVINQIDSTRIEFNREGRDYSGIKISPTSRPSIRDLRGNYTRDTAWIYRNGRIDTWPVEGRIEYQGRYCIGPRFDGKRLSEIITEGRLDIPTLRTVLSACTVLCSEQSKPIAFDASSIFLLNDGSLLVLSSSLAEKQRLCYSETEMNLFYEHFKHPDLIGIAGLVYSFALLSYIALTGFHPFLDRRSSSGNSIEDIRERIRRAEFVPLSLIKPESLNTVSVSIDSILEGSLIYPDLSELYGLLKKLDSEPAPILSQMEIQRMSRLAQRKETRIHRKIAGRRFFRRHKALLGITGVILIAASVLGVTILQKASLPPPTRGMEPEQVIRLFYESMNRLDHESMEACTADGAGSRYIETSVRLSVITRVSSAYSASKTPAFLPVQDWIEADFPALETGQFVFGTTKVSLQKTGETEYRVRYIIASPVSVGPGNDGNSVRVDLREHIDIVRLRRVKKDFRIYSLESEAIREIISFRDLKNE